MYSVNFCFEVNIKETYSEEQNIILELEKKIKEKENQVIKFSKTIFKNK